jgi:hypothetical protein
MEVCEQCHLETTNRMLPDRIRRYDQEPFGYKSNQPLASFNSHFVRDPNRGRNDNFEIVNAPYRLRQSQCYLKSQGALTALKVDPEFGASPTWLSRDAHRPGSGTNRSRSPGEGDTFFFIRDRAANPLDAARTQSAKVNREGALDVLNLAQ